MAGAQFMCPLMKADAICEFINDFDGNKALKISQTDISQPKPEIIQQVYALLFEDLVNVPVDQLAQPALSQMNLFEFPEIHEASLKLKHFSLCLRDIYARIGVDDFCIFDLINPKPKKTARNLSALINFHVFQGSRLDFVEQLREERENMKETKRQIMKDNKELLRKINIIKSRKAEQEPECLQVEAVVNELGRKLTEQQLLNSATQQDVYDKERELQTITLNRDHLETTLKRLCDECERLSQVIVVSPERVKQEEEHMKKHCQELKARRADLLKQEMEAVTKVKEKHQLINDCGPLLTLLTQLKDLYDEERRLQREHEADKDEIDAKKFKIKHMQAKNTQLKNALDGMNDNINMIMLQHSRKIDCLQEMKQKAIMELEKLNERMDRDNSSVAEVRKNQVRLVSEANEKLKKYQEEIQQLESKYNDLLGEIDLYHSHLGLAWQSAFST